jgi:hypothetical protein
MTPQSLRLLNHALVCTEGVAFDNAYGTDSLAVTAGSESLSVVVAAGSAFIEGGEFAGEGMYFVSNDADVTLELEGADPADPRCDLVIARVNTTATDCPDAWVLEVLTGVPAPVPTCPDVPVGAIPLATVEVAATATSITQADVTDQRQAYEYCGAPEFPYRLVYNASTQSMDREATFFGVPDPIFINNLTLPRPALVMTILSATFGTGGGSATDAVSLAINYTSPAFVESASPLHRMIRGNNSPLNAGASLVRLIEADAGLFTGNVFGGNGFGTVRAVEMQFRVMQWLE